MSKKPKKAPARKRPKSVMAKAWATRRAKKAAAYDPKKPLVPDMEAIAAMRREDALNAKKTRRSSVEVTHAPQWQPVDYSMPQTDTVGIKVEEILAAARSNDRSRARPDVRHKLYEMVSDAEFKGISAGMAAGKDKHEEAVLCALVAQFNLVDRPSYVAEFGPHIMSPVTMRIVVQLLESLGYTSRGKVDPSRMGMEKASQVNAIR